MMLTGILIGTFLTLGLVFGGTGYGTFLVLKWGHRHPAKLVWILTKIPGLLGISVDRGSDE